MKILHRLLLLAWILFSSMAVFSQQCANDSLVNYPSRDMSYTQQGFIDPGILPCVSSGNYSELVIPLKTYDQGARLLTLNDSSTVPVSQIYSINVESVSNLPTGLCWFMWPGSQTITGNKTGLLIIKGTTSVAAGTYPVAVNIGIDTQGSGTFNYTNLTSFNYKALLGQVILKVMGSDNVCPAITY